MPFLTWSKHVAAWHTLLLQTWLWQAPPGQQGCPAAPHCAQVPPKQTKFEPQLLPQHGCPGPPHAMHVPPEQIMFVPQAVPLETGVALQVPFVHELVVHAVLAGQTLPQAPQLLTSVLRLTQVPLQAAWPAGHGLTQWPD